MDFYQVRVREPKAGKPELYPDFTFEGVEDVMVRGGAFYAVWNEELGLWSQDEFDVARIVDRSLKEEAEERFRQTGIKHEIKSMRWSSSGSWERWRKALKNAPDNYSPLDTQICFANTEVVKWDYASKRLPYALAKGDISAWDELTTVLYDEEQRAKIEWAIGSIVAGDSKVIQKFFVFYGPSGTGKSTMLNIIATMFDGYTTVFDGKALGRSNGNFATAAFKNHPLVAIQHDADLSQLEDNSRLNSIIAHEEMEINEKYKMAYVARVDAMLFLGSNQPVKISDSKSGLLRRLVDIHPTGATFDKGDYDALMRHVQFELGAIADHCLHVYRSLGPNYYNAYRPLEMQLQTDVFYNFIEAYFDTFKYQNHVTLRQAYTMYKEFCEATGITRPLPMYKVREELRNYFLKFSERGYIDGKQVHSLYEGFVADKFRALAADGHGFSLIMDETVSLLDELLIDQPAQLAKADGTPRQKWAKVETTLRDIDTGELHFVKVPENHVVVDFDLEELGQNLEAASRWPPTYAELSKSGTGVHLHYTYNGDVTEVGPQYAPGIEVKVYTGDASLRRRVSRCNALPVSAISSGLPLKKKEKMLQTKTIASEKGLRELIERNLRKEVHPGTKPSIDFIKKILDDAYSSGMTYDVSDLQPRIIAFANNSTNQAALALKVVTEMKWVSENPGGEFPADVSVRVSDDRLVFFDVEVYPNLFVVCWKFQGSDDVVKMINPKAHEIEDLFKFKLVGFYNRRFDNHILYAASMGASNEQLFKLTQKLIEGNKSATFGAAYNLSYADIWDFSTERMSLKKFEIKLGILHMELDLPWDEDVPEDQWVRVVEYCANDVIATEAVFEDRKGDYTARQILAELSGLTVNDTTQAHTARIVFGDNVKTAFQEFEYTDLSKTFPGYTFDLGKSSYRGEDPGEGGYVYAEPGMYENVALLDVVSMHPRSIEILNLFGPYTKNYVDLIDARVAIKKQDYATARKLLDGRLAKFLVGAEEDPAGRHGTDLAYALRIALNIVYGLTSAKFDNPFRDIRNVDNIVAKRGALFMVDLKNHLQEAGYQVIHIKTDSVKIPNADPLAIAKVLAFGQAFGYEFEHEDTYDKLILVNDAVFVAGTAKVPWDGSYPGYDWEATGAQFQHPYVFKTLFSREEITFEDFCEARSVQKGTMYLDLTGSDLDQPDKKQMRHIGRTGLFVPVLTKGGILYRVDGEKYYAVAGTKGHVWMEAHIAKSLGDEVQIDMSYFEKLADDAIRTIEKFGDFEEFITPER